jgi:1,4-dihydroxy-2-naphthoyl-CoA hydrolase
MLSQDAIDQVVEEPEVCRAGDENENSTQAITGFEVLNFINFQMQVVSKSEMSGWFIVSTKSGQPFGVLHGGMTAYIAESLASMGAQIASDWSRVAGIEMNVAHLQAAPVGHKVMVKALPMRVGKRVQVWNVTFSMEKNQIPQSTEPQEIVITAVARVTLLVGLPGPEKAKVGIDQLVAVAKNGGNEKLLPFSKL